MKLKAPSQHPSHRYIAPLNDNMFLNTSKLYLIVSTLLSVLMTAQGMTFSSSRDVSSEIKECFDKWTYAWNEGNIEGYLDGYVDSPIARYVSGKTVTRGKDNIARMFKERGARGNLSLISFESCCVSEHDAICFGQYRLIQYTTVADNNEDSLEETQEGCFTVHVRRVQHSWKIISDHSS